MKKIKYLIPALAVVSVIITGCSNSDSNGSSGGGPDSGQGGSMARFTINGDYLYTVDNRRLNVVSISDPAQPYPVEDINVGSDIETIFTMADMLFIGSRGAMYIYDISRPEFPKLLSGVSHFKSCDPVVAYGNHAYVTLNNSAGTWCGGRGDVLQSYDITDPKNPELLDQYNLTSPYGLAVDGEQQIVFVCDKGIKAFDVSDPTDIRGLYTSVNVAEVRRVNAYDCIAMDGTLLVIGADGLYQLAYDREEFTFISKIDLR